MIHLYEELEGVLKREYEFCLEFVELLKLEKDIISRLNAEELEQLLRQKEMINFKIKGCDERRDQILKELGLEKKTIREVAMSVEGEPRQRLLKLAEDFSVLIQTIRDLNRINSMLIAKSLHYIKTSYNFLSTFNVKPKEKLSVEA